MSEMSPINPDSTIHRFFGSSWWVPFLITGVPLLIFAGGLWTLSEPRNGSCPCPQTPADIRSIENALDLYKLRAGHYPTTTQGLKALVEKPTAGPDAGDWQQIMKTAMLDPWKNPYSYRFPDPKNPDEPDIFSKGPDGIEGTDDDIHRND